MTGNQKTWHVFISYASEDAKVAFRLKRQLEAFGLRVWFDQSALKVGDSIRRKIERALLDSDYAVVVISKHFLSKKWPQLELDTLIAIAKDTGQILPVWHRVDKEYIQVHAPILLAIQGITTNLGIYEVARQIAEKVLTAVADRGLWERLAGGVVGARRFVYARLMPMCIVAVLAIGWFAVDRWKFSESRVVAPGLGVYLAEAQSNAAIDCYLAARSPLRRTACLYTYDARTGSTSQVTHIPSAVPITRDKSLYYISDIRRGEDSWTSLFFWSKAQLIRMRALAVSGKDSTHLVLVLNSRHRDRLRVGLKDIGQHEAKVSIELAPGWNVYAIPLTAFGKVDCNSLLLILLAHEGGTALEDHLQLEILDLSLRRLEQPVRAEMSPDGE